MLLQRGTGVSWVFAKVRIYLPIRNRSNIIFQGWQDTPGDGDREEVGGGDIGVDRKRSRIRRK